MIWNFIYGQEGSDIWVKQSEDGKYLLIKNYESNKDGVKKTIHFINIKQCE